MYDVTAPHRRETGVKRVADTSQTTDRDLLSDWLCILIKPHACFHFEHKLLPFFAKCENVVDLAAESWSRHQIGNKRSTFSLNGIKSRRIDLIRGKPAQFLHSLFFFWQIFTDHIGRHISNYGRCSSK